MSDDDPRAQAVVHLNEQILREYGVSPSKSWAILDYGCGSGRHVYEYLEAGYSNVFGFDIGDHVVRHRGFDMDRFRFGETHADGRMSGVPWPDDTFDLVFATSVFEHVQDQASAHAEIHRILKPGGVFLNTFPSKWRPLEPHTNIPFGGTTRAKWWYYLWTAVGVRRRALGGDIGRLERARLYHAYALTGVRYMSGWEIDRLMRDVFGSYRYVEDAFVRHSPGRSHRLRGAFAAFPVLRKVFRSGHTRVILAQKSA